MSQQAPWIEYAGVPPWRKLAAKALVAFAWLLGAAVLAIYVYIIWSDRRISPICPRPGNLRTASFST